MSFKYFLNLSPAEVDLIHPSTLTKFRKLRLKDMSLLDLLIKKTVEIAIDKGVLVSKTLIVDATHTNARYNQKSAREVLLERAKSLRKEVSSANMNQVIFLLPVIIIETIIISMFSRDLNIILTGDDTAKSLGIEVETARKTLLITCSIITAACVSVSGIIGFVGFIVPHDYRC